MSVVSSGVMARQVHVGRSDGRAYTTEEVSARKGSAKQVGEPIPENLNQIADVETRRKMALWKVVVGTGLAEELSWPKDSQYQLLFPEGFCLRWRNPAGTKKEAFLYGHPQDCSDDFLYKNPYEFVPHVLWLLSDSTDHKECPCQPCHIATGRKWPQSFKEKMEKKAAALAVETKAAPKKTAATTMKSATTTKKKTSTATITSNTSSTSTPALKESAPPAKTKKSASAKATPVATPSPALKPTVPAAPAPAPAPAPAVAAAPHPAINDEPTLFRRGEMVWYQQDPAWRIGIIRQVGTGSTPIYTVIPLGHALLNLSDVQKQQIQMRPFLTFSVPAIGIQDLQSKIFSQADWQGLLNAYAGRTEVVGLEASKMAALEIDGSWSTFNRLAPGPKQRPDQSVYGGVFLGAEMIRLGDPIRAKDKNRGTLLEVVEITVTQTTPAASNSANPSNTSAATQNVLTFRGIEYEACHVPEQARVPAQPQGAIFLKDTSFRTSAARATGSKTKCVWTIKSWDTVWQEGDVAGRSYVTDELIGVTKGQAAVDSALRTGNFAEASAFLNNRMQNAASRNFGRRTNRRVTVGAAVAAEQPLVLGGGVAED